MTYHLSPHPVPRTPPVGRLNCGRRLLVFGPLALLYSCARLGDDPAGTGTTAAPIAPTRSDPSPLQIGERGVVRRSGGNGIWLAADDRSYDELIDAENAGSQDLLNCLMGQGRVF